MKTSHFYFFFLIRSWNSFDFFDRCIDSVFAQESDNYTILFIEDGSPYAQQQKSHIKQKLKKHHVFFNQKQQFSLKNAYEYLHIYAEQQSVEQINRTIVISLDGDDWLLGTDVLQVLEKTYLQTKCLCTYGNCLYYEPGSWRHNQRATDVDATTNRRYPLHVDVRNAYRAHLEFPPLHLKTWRLKAFLKIPKAAFLRPNGSWLQFCEDQAILYPLLEMAKGRYAVIEEVLSVYNRSHQQSDETLHHYKTLKDEVTIRKMK